MMPRMGARMGVHEMADAMSHGMGGLMGHAMRRIAPLAVLLLAACDGGTAATSGAVDAGDAAPPGDAAPEVEPDAAPPARVWFVAAGATGGDGSRERPFGAPAAAYAVAVSGDLVLLLPGEHPSPPLPPAGVVLSGSGPEVTRVPGPLVLDRAGVELRELGIVGGAPALAVRAAARVEALAVVADDGPAVAVDGPLEARDLVAEGAPALAVGVDGALSARGGHLRGRDDAAVVEGGEATLEGVALSASGDALRLESGVARLAPARIEGAAVGARVLGGRLTIDGGTARRVEAAGAVGAAVRVTGGQADVSALVVEGGDRGLRVDAGGRLTVRGVVVYDPATDGLSLQGGEADVEGLRVERPGNAGVVAIDGATLDLRQATVVAPRRVGLLVDGATLRAAGLSVEAAETRGVSLLRAVASIDGMAVRGAGDVGVQITDPAGPVMVAAAQIEGAGTTGLSVFGDSGPPVELSGLVVEGTVVGEGGLADGVHVFAARARIDGVVSRGNAGAGIVFEQATGSVSGGELSGNADPGLVVIEPGEPVQVAELIVRDNGGAGMVAVGGALEVDRCVVEHSRANPAVGPGHGLHAVAGGALAVTGGRSAHNAGSGVGLEPATRGAVGGVELLDNAGYGLLAACGAEVFEPAPNVFRGNAAGERAVCDR